MKMFRKSNKSTVLLLFLFILGCILYNFKDFFIAVFFPVLEAADLSGSRLRELNAVRLASSTRFNHLVFNFSFIFSFILPVLLIILGFLYKKHVRNLFIHCIGKLFHYTSSVERLKHTLSFAAVAVYACIYLSVVLASVFSCEMFSSFSDDLKIQFTESSVLRSWINTPALYALFYFLVKAVAVYINAYIYFCLLDIANSYVKGSLCYLIFFWGASVVLYGISLTWLSPMTTLMSLSYAHLTFGNILLPYSLYALLALYRHVAFNFEVAP